MASTTKIKLVSIAFMLAVLTGWSVYHFFGDRLPPRTHLKVAREITGLDIPDDVKFLKFESHDSWGGDYMDEIVIQLSEKQTSDLKNQWEEKGYGNEPIPRIDSSYLAGKGDFISNNTQASDSGFHKYSQSDGYVCSLVLDFSSNRLLIFDAND